MSDKMKYFLDHPQIKRKPSWGNAQKPIETNDGGGGQKIEVKDSPYDKKEEK